MVVASPPFPWGVDAFFGIVFLAWMVAANRPESKGGWGQFHTSTTVVFALLLLVLPSIEFLHRRFPTIRGEKSDHVVVVGDSISAGLGAGTSRWPDLLHELTGTAVTNLSKPGATTMDGPAMIARLVQEDHLVLIELGGNDLISGERSEDFERSLGEVLARLASPRRTIVNVRVAPFAAHGPLWAGSAAAREEVRSLVNSQALSGDGPFGEGRHFRWAAFDGSWRSSDGIAGQPDPFAGPQGRSDSYSSRHTSLKS